MGVELLTERYQSQIAGVLSCYDRFITRGTLPKWCYAKGMTDYFYEHQIRIFDYPKWAEPLRDAIRENMERIAAENGIEIEFVRSKKKFRQFGLSYHWSLDQVEFATDVVFARQTDLQAI